MKMYRYEVIGSLKDLSLFLKKWIGRQSGLFKLALMISVIQALINIGGSIYIEEQKDKMEKIIFKNKIEKEIERDKIIKINKSSEIINFYDQIGELRNLVFKSFIILIILIISYFIYLLCKILDLFRGILEYLARFDGDDVALYGILLYDLLGVYWNYCTVVDIMSYVQ